MVEVIELWQCVGCGRIEAPQPCIGVCRDRKLRVVDAVKYEALRAECDRSLTRAERAEEVLRMIASSEPTEGHCGQHWRALRARARALLTTVED